jgi:hypothetical protein
LSYGDAIGPHGELGAPWRVGWRQLSIRPCQHRFFRSYQFGRRPRRYPAAVRRSIAVSCAFKGQRHDVSSLKITFLLCDANAAEEVRFAHQDGGHAALQDCRLLRANPVHSYPTLSAMQCVNADRSSSQVAVHSSDGRSVGIGSARGWHSSGANQCKSAAYAFQLSQPMRRSSCISQPLISLQSSL